MSITAPNPQAASSRPRVGIVGAGQLARMTAQAAIDLGIDLVTLASSPADPAIAACADHVVGPPSSLAALIELAGRVDVVTFDHEHVPSGLARSLVNRGSVVRPGPAALELVQDKLVARADLAAAQFPVPAFAPLDGDPVAGVSAFAADHGWPVVAKARGGGYDGRGVALIAGPADAAFLTDVPPGSWYVEAHVPFVRELAVVLARRPSGEVATYPLVETVQQDGICVELLMPAPVDRAVAGRATSLAVALANGVDAVGIVAVELFLLENGGLVVNELAVRPHNSGHGTIEGTVTSQFENHLRAVLDWPLGSTDLMAPAVAMANVLGDPAGGDPMRRLPRALTVPGAHVHLYGKSFAPGRKLGHVTVTGADMAEARAAAQRCTAILTGSTIG